ncbi:Dipeptide-binding ABC transporter, periplasmic substrate-binding component [Devosia sp. LC5]|uniref:ABC transporter substrate-binding protein n=1 Tax=Devosia sp. LC5 TaxID=1502724 RepID=UPI0004E3982E|nr:ABC transporter substrate-binding protein [Devosia sp. LC5]KFC61240.1 Dipeptide-binding ABC transporter, periplasmic substrate-binding component [Devosia sp. LC5]
MSLRKTLATLLATTLLTGMASAATLNVAIDSSPAGLDPHLITAFNSVVIVQSNIYEGLTAIDKDLAVVPGLAESWEISEDGLSYTFKLRSGVKFHDGSDMDAEDVAASIRRVQSEAVASPLASRVTPITGIEVVDPTSIKFTLDAPFAPILTSLSGIAIVPAEVETNVEGLQQTPIGTGPFKFAEWQPNGFIGLTRNEDYYLDGLPKLEGVKFNFVPESATRQVGVTSGEYDLLPGIDPATALQLQGQPNVTVQETRDIAYTLLGMNTSREPFTNPKVRTAINMLLNRQEIIDAALFGSGVPAGPLSPALVNWAVDPTTFACYTQDVEGAKALLAEAGVTTPLQVSMNVLPRQDTRDIAQVVQQQLAAGGIEVSLLTQEIGDFVQSWKNSDFDTFISANGGSPDPDEYFYRTFRGGGSTNVFKYEDPEIDTWLDQGRAETDPAARKAIYDQVQAKLACDGPAAHIAYGTLYTAVANGVDGFEIFPNGRLTSLVNTTKAE